MGLAHSHSQFSTTQEWDDGLREKVLALVSDPTSSVVPFPPRRARAQHRRGASLNALHLMPAPDPKTAAARGRLVPQSQRSKTFMAVSTYVAIVLTGCVGGASLGMLLLQSAIVG